MIVKSFITNVLKHKTRKFKLLCMCSLVMSPFSSNFIKIPLIALRYLQYFKAVNYYLHACNAYAAPGF